MDLRVFKEGLKSRKNIVAARSGAIFFRARGLSWPLFWENKHSWFFLKKVANLGHGLGKKNRIAVRSYNISSRF